MLLQQLPTGLKLRQPWSGPRRIPFVRHCSIDGPLNRQQGLVCDLSTAGAYVRLHGELEPGTVVWISFEIFAGELPLVAEAIVAWQNVEPRRIPELPPGCGLRFSGMGPRDAARIKAVVEGYTTPSASPGG
jgi:hypothetical protein